MKDNIKDFGRIYCRVEKDEAHLLASHWPALKVNGLQCSRSIPAPAGRSVKEMLI
jgi:hypothetical protein